MMKVQMLRSPGASWDCKLTEGETGTVDEQTGKRLVASGLAVEIAEPKEIKAVPDAPAIAEAEPAPIKAPKPAPKPKEDNPSVGKATSRLKDYVTKQRDPQQKDT